MAKRREPVKLIIGDGYAQGMATIQAASRASHIQMVLRAATWEPHDWADYQ